MAAEHAVAKQPGFVEKYALPYYLSLFLYLAYICIIEYTGKPALVIAFVLIIQSLGRFLPKDSGNFTAEHSKYHNAHFYHMVPLLANVFATWGVLAYTWSKYSVLTVNLETYLMSAQAVALIISTSLNASHELFHKTPFWCRAVGVLNMAVFQFSVYPIEHIHYHHKNVGTSKDPIMSPKNRNLYLYFVKVIYTAHRFTFQYSKIIFLGCMALNASYLGGLYFLAYRQYQDVSLALSKVGFFIVIGAFGLVVLEIIEYIEHYGLIFDDGENKQKVRELSSWNSDKDIIFNWLSFRFQRHSDHHMNAYKYYSTSDLTPAMPRFAFSFFEGIILALIPPLWYYIMNPYVDQQLKGQKIDPKHDSKVKIIKQSIFLSLIIYLLVSSF